MPDSFDYAVIRVVPRVERGEFLNAGAILYCLARDFLAARVELDEARLFALAAHADLDLPLIREHLAAFPRISAGGDGAGPIGKLPQKERFKWLTAPRSTVVQVGPVHTGLCEDPAEALERLLDRMVRVQPR